MIPLHYVAKITEWLLLIASACVKFTQLIHVVLLHCHKGPCPCINNIVIRAYCSLIYWTVSVAVFAVVVILIFITHLAIRLENRGMLLLWRSFCMSHVDTMAHTTQKVYRVQCWCYPSQPYHNIKKKKRRWGKPRQRL